MGSSNTLKRPENAKGIPIFQFQLHTFLLLTVSDKHEQLTPTLFHTNALSHHVREGKVFTTMDSNNLCHKLQTFLCESPRPFSLVPAAAIATLKITKGSEGLRSLGKLTAIFALYQEWETGSEIDVQKVQFIP